MSGTNTINTTDIENDKEFIRLFKKIGNYTSVSIERSYALYKAVKYILENNIKGDFVECGVWKGGSCMLLAYMLKDAGVTNRGIWLYDTFMGMTAPGPQDGNKEKKEWEEKRITAEANSWCLEY